MGLLDNIIKWIKGHGKGKSALLPSGEENWVDISKFDSRRGNFKESVKASAGKILIPEQWQIKFLKENNCSEYIKNPFILKYLLSIPEIACIKDAESYKSAKDYNSLFENNMRKQIIYLKGKKTNGENDVRIQFSKSASKRLKNNIYVFYGNNLSEDAIDGIEDREYDIESGIDRIEYRKYDIESGIEIKRSKIDKKDEIQIVKVYTRDTDSIGKATFTEYLTEYNSSSKARITRYNTGFYDLTTAISSDIGTLDGVAECSPEEYPIEYQSGEGLEDYDDRLKNKIANSLNSEACKKYEGIPTDKAERIQ